MVKSNTKNIPISEYKHAVKTFNRPKAAGAGGVNRPRPCNVF